MDAMKLLGSLMENKSLASGLGGNLLGGLLGGGGKEGGSSAASLMGLLGSGSGGSSPIAGLMGMLGGGGGQGGPASMVSGLLGSVMGGGQEEAAPQQQQAVAAPQEAQDQAVIMIRAMINAAKSDGRIDQAEVDKIIGKLGDVSQAEADFLREEFKAPLEVHDFAKSVPNGMEQQVYAISLTSIELDTQNEAQYLAHLGQNMDLTPQVCNQIHEQLGAPVIFK